MGKRQRSIEVAARSMIRRYGRTAVEQIDQRIVELQAHGEDEVASFWQDVRALVKMLFVEDGNGKCH